VSAATDASIARPECADQAEDGHPERDVDGDLAGLAQQVLDEEGQQQPRAGAGQPAGSTATPPHQHGQDHLDERQQRQQQHAVDGVPAAPGVASVQEQAGEDRLGEHRHGEQPQHHLHPADDPGLPHAGCGPVALPACRAVHRHGASLSVGTVGVGV
jgi:hypothetical protein